MYCLIDSLAGCEGEFFDKLRGELHEPIDYQSNNNNLIIQLYEIDHSEVDLF